MNPHAAIFLHEQPVVTRFQLRVVVIAVGTVSPVRAQTTLQGQLALRPECYR
jgi:hypothetical protein